MCLRTDVDMIHWGTRGGGEPFNRLAFLTREESQHRALESGAVLATTRYTGAIGSDSSLSSALCGNFAARDSADPDVPDWS